MNLKNQKDFIEMKRNRNNNQLTHTIEYGLEDYNFDLKEFLKDQESNLENLDSEVKKKHILDSLKVI